MKLLESFFFFFFAKQPLYKQLVLGWQVANQYSGLNPPLLNNNKNYRFKTWCLSFVINVK